MCTQKTSLFCSAAACSAFLSDLNQGISVVSSWTRAEQTSPASTLSALAGSAKEIAELQMSSPLSNRLNAFDNALPSHSIVLSTPVRASYLSRSPGKFRGQTAVV